jgi:hypothetical protein
VTEAGRNRISLCQVSWSAPDGSLALASACMRSAWSPHLGHFDPAGLTWATDGALAGSRLTAATGVDVW